ncbi:hypothetical protein Tco_0149386 [Tanacetum coccineum]
MPGLMSSGIKAMYYSMVEFFKGWKPLSPLQLAVEEVIVASLDPIVIAPALTDSTGTPSLTTIDQDAPSPSTSQTPQETLPLVIPFGVEEEFHNIEVVHLDKDPFFGVPILELNFEESSSQDVIPTNVHSVNQPPKHLRKWTKDHPLDNINGSPSQPVSTRHQLKNKSHVLLLQCFPYFR